MRSPRPVLRDDEDAVSEVVGTIMILGMTVTLFAVIILWVSSIPTPQAGTRLELDGQMTPIVVGGSWAGANITIVHRGGEDLSYFDTRVYLVFERTDGTHTTEVLRTRGIIAYGPNAGDPYGLLDGRDDDWQIGERWSITNRTVQPTDKIRAEVVDIARSVVLWSEQILGPVGTHPPIFLEKWSDGDPDTSTLEVPETGSPFTIYVRMFDEDGDLQSVNATLTIFYGTPDPCRTPQELYDDGTNGDRVRGDGVWTLSRECMVPSNLSWDGSIVLFTATDGNFTTESRLVLRVVLGPLGEDDDGGGGVSGRPPNLRYNGLQGYNFFNASQWDSKEFSADETRTFRGNERVVVVVGSLLLTDAVGKDEFYMFDPFSGAPPDPVVYGTGKSPTKTTKPTNLLAFKFYKNVNGYNVFIYRFDLNNASSSGVNFFRNPIHPPFYFFARYSVTIDIIDSQGTRFNTTDAINITDSDGFMRQFPLIETYADAGFTQKTNKFASTDNVYVAVSMFTVDPNTDFVTFGTISVRDFLGGSQILKSFINGREVNSPLCRITGACTPGTRALDLSGPTVTYRFMINLTLADQDPWVEGSQNYAMQISYIDDADETYGGVSHQLVVTAPLFRMDVAGGNLDTTGPAWGTHDYGYYYENLNGLDKWRKTRFEYCGLPGVGNCKNAETRSVVFLNADTDNDLDIAASVKLDNNNAEINYYRRDVDFDGNVIFVKFILTTLGGNNVFCNDLESGDLTGDTYPEIVCGLSDGRLGYFRNDGSWTTGSPSSMVSVDATRAQAIHGVTLGDFDQDGDMDIAVSRDGGTVTYYLNLDGLGTFSTGGITDRWFAEAEITLAGTVTTPDYLRTFNSDNDWEVIREGNVTEPVRSGSTSNPDVDAGSASWTYADWESAAQASGEWHAAGGNPNGLIDVHMAFLASQTVSGYYHQSFSVTGSPPFTATVDMDYRVSTFGGSSVTVYAFVDGTAGAPNIANAIASFSHTGTTTWQIPATITVPSSRIPVAGTYYLKFAARTTNGAAGSLTTVQFDNIQLGWSSTGGPASEMAQYWRIQQLPNRPLSTYSLRLEGHHTPNPEGDFFAIAYSTNVVGGDPTTGTYTTILWVNSTTDTIQTYNFPVSLQAAIVWIRAIDMDHKVGNTSLDTLRMDQVYIEVATQPIQPGSVIVLPSAPGNAWAIDAGDQNGDAYDDVVVGTTAGKVYKLVGFSGGLQTPTSCFFPAGCGVGTSIVGIKLANITSAGAGLDIAIAYGTTVRVITGDGAAGSSIAILSPGTAAAITSLAAGDVDGDGDDDVIVSTQETGQALKYYRNLNFATGTSWRDYNIEPLPAGTTIEILDIDIGDGNKAQYMGR